MQAYRVLAEPDSPCSKWGRELCLAIEKATGVPTYYYLMRYFGREYAEEKRRRCPCCGKSWHIKRPEKEGGYEFWEFDFMCKKCRLVSNCACGDVNLRYAKIGEPRKEKK
jgi:predicted  nucleic acid-binding Zn ribbon protein